MINNFFKTEREGEELKDAITRILVYPNITYQRDLSKDSYVQVIKKMITTLNERRDDLWFYLPLTEFLPSLDFYNVTQQIVQYPTYPNTMRTHFDAFKWKELLKYNTDVDLVFSHLPEHTLQLSNVIYNVTHHRPSFFGYSHWFEFDEVTGYSKDVLPVNVLGILEMETCYVNTEDQKQLLLEEAEQWFNEDIIDRLDDIMEPFHLGVDQNDIVDKPLNSTNKVIVFNHRPHAYKDFGWFLNTMDKLWEKRQDFKVWIPLSDKPNKPYVYTDMFDKEGYYDHLRQCRVGLSPKQVYRGWSVSTTDGLMNGCPFVMYDDPYYHELWDGADFFHDTDSALKLLNRYLDKEDYRNEKAVEGIDFVRNNLLYNQSISKIDVLINNLVADQHTVKETDSYKKIVRFIKENGRATKNEIRKFLRWGRRIPWTPYRRRLSKDDRIKEVLSEEPIYVYKEESI